MATRQAKLFDFYLARPIIIDFGLISLFLILTIFLNWFRCVSLSIEQAGSIYSAVISTCISLAGFILAALTIIVTFRSNLKAKGFDDSKNALDFILSSKMYRQIVLVYRKAILEFIFISLSLFLCWLFASLIKDSNALLAIAVSGVFATSTTIFRSLWVLFKILHAEHIPKT